MLNKTSVQLLEVLANSNPGRIGEINLLLETLSKGKRSVTITNRALIEMAGKSDGAIKCSEYIVIGKELQLIRQNNNELELTDFGRQVISVASWPPYDRLNQEQIILLAPEIVGHPEIKSHILSFLSRLTRLPDLKSVYLLGSQKINDGEITCIQMLQVLGLVEAINEYLYISHQQYMELVSYIGEIPFRSEEDL